jgi:GxxExxY protein
MIEQELTEKIIGAAIDVHRYFGPGLLESVYRECLYYELKARNLKVAREVPMPVIYKGIRLEHAFRLDLIVEDRIVLELKSVSALNDVHFAQLLSYLRLGNYSLGLLINFDVRILKNGIKRIINSTDDRIQ